MLDAHDWYYLQIVREFTCRSTRKRFFPGECLVILKHNNAYGIFECLDVSGGVILVPEDIAEKSELCPAWHNEHVATAL
ncbi:MAG TPA: hypothetical protein PLB51_02650 [Candidatus Paceibacterota bacterium]|jgi:hypothetical protein|nr:hypothetical protein [Candidatus Paceibacterota bacterium]